MIRTNGQIILKRLAASSIASLLACMLASCGMKEESAPKSTDAAPPTLVVQPAEPQNRTFEKYSKEAKPEAQPEVDHETATRAPAAAGGRTFEKYSEKAKQEAQPAAERKTAKRAPAAAGEVPKAESAADYMVKLGADPVLRIPGPPGELRVWIGLPAYEPDYLDLKTRTDTLPAQGKTAKVTAFAPGLKVEPDTYLCMKTNPRGSEVRFKLIPVESGTFKVGADVALFDSDDCSGAPIPKATTTLQVDVSVDRMKLTVKYMTELWEVFWSKLLKFWGEALALFFAALLFLFRKKLKKWFGYSE